MRIIAQTAWVMVGIPGSGKSAVARRLVDMGALSICGDDIRAMVNGGRYAFRPEIEPLIRAMTESMMHEALLAGFNVVVDETHHTVKRRREMILEIRSSVPYARIVAIEMEHDPVACLARRRADTKGLNPEEWTEIIGRFAVTYEPVGAGEGFDRVLRGASALWPRDDSEFTK